MKLPYFPAICAGFFAGCTLISSHGAPVRFDFNDPGSPTQPGWFAAELGTGTEGELSVSTVAIGGVTLASRDRMGRNTDGFGANFDNVDMWRDFVFASGSTAANPGSGLEVTISGLNPDTTYPIKVWAFDDDSNAGAGSPGRAADWSTNLEAAPLVFPSGPDPGSLNDYVVTLHAMTDEFGIAVLTGLVAAINPDPSHNVFINGLEIGNALGDSDGDGMQDSFEQDIIDADPDDDIETIADVLPDDDFDGDGSSNREEEIRGTSPINPDTDGDTIPDGAEDGGGVWISESMRGTDPLSTDSDQDGLSDRVENPDLPYDPANPLEQPGTDPNIRDTDGDKASDFREVAIDGTDPTDPGDTFDPLADAIAMFDFNAPGSPVQFGWTAADLGTGSDGAISVTTTELDGGAAVFLDSRDRANLGNTDDSTADVENADLWRDFVFANGSFNSVPGSGIRITISGLQPSTSYPITIWAFDDSSDGGRSADWGVSGSATSTNLTFPSGPDPASLLDYTIRFDAVTDPSGQLVIDGVVAAGTPTPSHNVFVNALVIGSSSGAVLPVITSVNYDPPLEMATVTWRSRPGRVYALDATKNLELWIELADDIQSQGESTTYIESSLAPTDTERFYRVRETD